MSADGTMLTEFDTGVPCARGTVVPPVKLRPDGAFRFTGAVGPGKHRWISISGTFVARRLVNGTFRVKGPACDSGVVSFTGFLS